MTPADLIARLEAATGADKVLDRAIMALLYKRRRRFIGGLCQGCGCKDAPRHKDMVWVDPATDRWVTTAFDGYPFTASLDAVLALVERRSPALNTAVWRHDGKWGASLATGDFYATTVAQHTYSPTPALALLIALLRAEADNGQ